MKDIHKLGPRIVVNRGGGGGGLTLYSQDGVVVGFFSAVDIRGDILGYADGSTFAIEYPPPAYAPWYNQGSAAVGGPTYSSYYVATDNTGITYGEGGWDNQAPHPCTRNASVQYSNGGICTHLEGGTIDAQVSYYDAANTLQQVTVNIVLDGTAKDVTVTGLRVEVYNLTANQARWEGNVRTTITFASLPGWGTGGRIVNFSTVHTFSGTPYTYSFVAGVFQDVRPTPPTVSGVPTFSLTTPDPSRNFAAVLANSGDYGWLSGIPHLTNGAIWNVLSNFTQVHNDTYVLNPYDYNFSIVGGGTGSIQYNDASITGVSIPPEDSDTPTSMNLNRTTAGTSICVNGTCSCSLRVSDPWGNSGYVSSNILNNYRIFNRVSSSSNNYEDFRSELYRQPATSDFDSGPVAITGMWNSISSTGAVDAQQDLCGRLIRPGLDYTGYVPSGRDYSAGFNPITYYYRFFRQVGSYSNGALIINGTYTSIFLKIGAPWDGTPSGGTVWVDYALGYDFINWNDGNPSSGGCRGVGNAWTVGSNNTINTIGDDGLWIRIGMSAGDVLTDITCTFL